MSKEKRTSKTCVNFEKGRPLKEAPKKCWDCIMTDTKIHWEKRT